ncbi:hypothetical protein K469DRAFT_593858 [Zopfia rhizophila CBS 207.26]|uniref:SnoaL-like domain-containing protein n=1 Tax=Zopfia rhizophila CBS 207.26 TaxID=1314779 RepID=A0A6A6DNK8_9PEZI|nr:hypothetical protein K469DRAFT_593858 [Zopfia rhizophila CBS 207.26]
MDYTAYIKAYNIPNNHDELFKNFYTEDVRLQDGNVDVKGADSLRQALKAAQTGLKEELRIIHYAQKGDIILAELDSALVADRDIPDFFITPLKKSQTTLVRFFASYTIRDGKIAHFRLGYWGNSPRYE